MTTTTDHQYSASVIAPGGNIALSWGEDSPGDVTLDAAANPHVQGTIRLAVEDAMLLTQLDPRDSRRVVIDVDATLPNGDTSRSFDLGIRRATPDRGAGTVTLTLASDEALTMDYAQLVDDNTPRSLQTSLRAVCDYVLEKVTGLAPNRAMNPRATSTAQWTATQSGAGSPTFTAASTPGLNVGGEGIDTFLRAQATADSTYLDVRGLATNNLLVAPLGASITVSSWVRPSSIGAPLGRVYVQQYDAGGVLLGTQDAVAPVASGQFARVSLTVTRMAGAVRVVPIFRITGVAPVGSRLDITGFVTEQTSRLGTYRDRVLAPGVIDADVTAYWPITNLFTNPSFENTVAGWVNGSLATGLAPTATQKLVGNYSGHWQTTGAGQSFIDFTGPISVQAGRSYVFSASMRATVARPARVMTRFKNAAGVILSDRYSVAVNLTTTGWTPLSTIQVAPAGATQATAHVEYQASGGGQFPYVDALMFYEGNEVVPYHDGDTPDTANYDYAWTGPAQVSTSTRTPTVERPPEALLWSAGVSAMAFLEPLLKAAGLRLVCDEQRRWSLRNAEYRAAGAQAYRHGVNIETADEELSREDDAWFDAAVYVYIWTDSNGIEQRRVDAFALAGISTKVLRVELRDTVYPGPGRAESIVRRAQGRGRTVTASAIPTWTEQTDQYLSIALEGTPIQTGIAGSVRYDFGADTVTVSSRTVDTPAGAIDLLVGTINALPGTINTL